ncbi:zinc ribbon domain-containing protein [uncultured Clostridium sp.]|uniref:zinc ribbon domain-containing protein n=1 Tax=uncultured Clostridium sp. TaxID=59620 RepID=UPI0025CFD3D4|nr:zinc ribbon domain-containing protein [uncultured Clostridium sp.]
MNCKYCGHKLYDDSNVCINCGIINDKYSPISFSAKFVSLLLPLVGISMFIMLKFKKHPDSHKILLWTFSGILLWTILYAAALIMGIIITFQI